MAQTEDLLFSPDNTYNIGADGASRPKDCYLAGRVLVIDSNPVLGGNANDMTVAHLGQSGTIQLRTYNANRWQITSSGHLQAVTDNAYDIGASGANRPRNIYTAGAIYPRSTNNWLDASGADTILAADGTGQVVLRTGGTQRWKISNAGHILAVADNAYDIGALGANRPRNAYLAGQLFVLDNNHTVAGNANDLTLAHLGAGGTIQLRTYNANRWQVTSAGHLQAVADNAYDIGASSANRPRTGYFGSGVVVGSDGIKWKATSSNVNVMYASGSEDIQILRHFGTKPNTLLRVWAPVVTDWQNDDREATIALVRGEENSSSDPQEFLDLYNNYYSTEKQYGIRIQKRGTGSSYHDFVFDQHDGFTPKQPMFKLKADRNAEFWADWVRLPIPDTSSGDPDTTGWGAEAAGRMWFNNNSAVRKISYAVWTGSAIVINRLNPA